MSLSPDEQFWIGLGIGVIGLILTLLITWYQRQVPELVTSFAVPEGSPAVIKCSIRNMGRGQATDVVVSFAFMLPAETHVYAPAEQLVTLEEVDSPPNPTLGSHAAALGRAFAIRIPRIAARDSVTFQIRTIDPDNIRAAEQVCRIREEIERILAEFGNRLTAVEPELGKLWELNLIMSGRVKSDCFFKPMILSYDRGRTKITVLSPEEELAAARCQDIYASFKSSLLDVFQGRPEFKAPVVRFKTSEGVRTYAAFPPFVRTYIEVAVPVSQLSSGKHIVTYPPVPHSYV